MKLRDDLLALISGTHAHFHYELEYARWEPDEEQAFCRICGGLTPFLAHFSYGGVVQHAGVCQACCHAHAKITRRSPDPRVLNRIVIEGDQRRKIIDRKFKGAFRQTEPDSGLVCTTNDSGNRYYPYRGYHVFVFERGRGKKGWNIRTGNYKHSDIYASSSATHPTWEAAARAGMKAIDEHLANHPEQEPPPVDAGNHYVVATEVRRKANAGQKTEKLLERLREMSDATKTTDARASES